MIALLHYYGRAPIGRGIKVDGCHLSVHLSVCAVSDPKLGMEWHSKLEIGRMEAHETGDPWPQVTHAGEGAYCGGQTARLVFNLCCTFHLTDLVGSGQVRYQEFGPVPKSTSRNGEGRPEN